MKHEKVNKLVNKLYSELDFLEKIQVEIVKRIQEIERYKNDN